MLNPGFMGLVFRVGVQAVKNLRGALHRMPAGEVKSEALISPVLVLDLGRDADRTAPDLVHCH